MNAIELVELKQWLESKDREKYKEAIEQIEKSLGHWVDELAASMGEE